jgi:hypothetical protein
MFKEVHSYSKADQLKGHQKSKDKPKFKEKRPKKKKKKLETFKGRTIPPKKVRGKVTTADYKKAQEEHGESCFFCGSPFVECHHVVPKGFSRHKNGRGVWRNLCFLCTEHHRGDAGVHQDKEKMELLQELHEMKYGPNFYKDRFDLFKEGLTPNTDKDTFESFMEREREQCLIENHG